MRFEPYRLVAVLTLLVGTVPASAAPLSYNGGTYTQNFDGLPTNITNPTQTITGRGPHEFSAVTAASGLTGWQLGNPSGSSTNTDFRSHNGSLSGSAGRGVVSYGDNGSTERALGFLPTSNQISQFGLVLTNNTGATIQAFELSFTGEQWRRGDVATPDTLTFAYGLGNDLNASLTDAAALTFSSPNTQLAPTEVALNGNALLNQVLKSATITGLNWQDGQNLVLRWRVADISGQDDGLAIDNLSFAAVPEPAACLLGVLGACGSLLIVRRSRR
jgi:hypothetical protein